ncbi:MAG: hypothetical protein C0418_02530 [Coriobacteriaceae bacterium]|nr:hypothetical protein [Coriobacteriaceae bacterium]
MVRIAVHVTPKAGRDEIAGWHGSELAVRVTGAPEAGKANTAVRELVALALRVPKSTVRVVRGETSRHKMLEADGTTAEDVRAAFGDPPPELS